MVFHSFLGVSSLFAAILSPSELLYRLESFGLFDFILPFVLVFCIIFGILSYMKIFGNHVGIHVVIAVALALMALRAPFLADFLSVLSPRLGVGLVILLALIILIGMFVPEGSRSVIGWILLSVGVIIFIVILAQSSAFFDTFGLGSSEDLITYVVIVALIIGLIVAVVSGSGKRQGQQGKPGKQIADALKSLWD